MPNNVYIGSRYVPLFDDEWSAIKTYEPLTIVEYGNNTFTSKRPVPLNTPPTTGDANDPYWALTGNYNGQIANLQNQINANASNITALTNNIKEILINPLMYGAAGDGVTDDTSALNSCIIDGAKIDLGGKSYKISGAIDFTDHANIEFCNGTIIRNVNALHNTFFGWRAKNIYIHDIHSDAAGNDAGTTYTWPDTMQAFAIIARSSNIYIDRCIVERYKYGICTLGANSDQSINPDDNRSWETHINHNIFKNCGCGADLYGKNIEIAYNLFKGIDGDGAVIIEPEGTSLVNLEDPMSYADINLSAFNANIHDNFANDVSTFVSIRRGADFINVIRNFVTDYSLGVWGVYANNVIVEGNYFSKQKNNAADPTKTRAYQYLGTITLPQGIITNNSFYNVLTGIQISSNIAADPARPHVRAIVAHNIFDGVTIYGVNGHVLNATSDQILVIDDNYFTNIASVEASFDYFYRPVQIDAGLAVISNNVFDTARKSIGAYGTNVYASLLNNLVKTPQTDAINPISNLSMLTNVS